MGGVARGANGPPGIHLMGHIPHLVVGAPWDDEAVELSVMQWRHVTKVLRMKLGEDVTYTDGLGVIGSGALGHQVIERGQERTEARPTDLTVAVAPPANKHRQRFLVEKLAEMGVARLVWLETQLGKNRVASSAKVLGWIHAATEQSRGAYLMEASADLVKPTDLRGMVVYCGPEGAGKPGDLDVVAIGPEGGFAEDEIPQDAEVWTLGSTILRVETAAVVAAARLTNF